MGHFVVRLSIKHPRGSTPFHTDADQISPLLAPPSLLIQLLLNPSKINLKLTIVHVYNNLWK